MSADPKQTSLASPGLSAIVAALACAAIVGCMERIDSVPEFVQLAERHEREENFSEAAAAYTKAIELNSEDPSLWYDRGVANLNSDNVEQAIADYTRAVELDPEFIIAWNNLGAALLQNGEIFAAIEACSQAIELDQFDPLPRRNRGLAFHRLGLFDQSLEDLSRAIQADSENPFLHFSRATTLLDSHRPASAIEDFLRASEMDNANPDPRIGLAVAFARIGQMEDAATALKEAQSRGFDSKDLTVDGLRTHRRPPVPDIVARNLKDGGYTESDGTWTRDGRTTNLVYATVRNGSVQFKAEQLNALDAANASHTLVVVALTEEGLQIVTRINDWKPDTQSMEPVEFTMPVGAGIDRNDP